jgi:hypothetical protein
LVANCKTPAGDQSERSFSERVNYVSGDLVDQEYAIPTKIRPAEKYAVFPLTREGSLFGACSLLQSIPVFREKLPSIRRQYPSKISSARSSSLPALRLFLGSSTFTLHAYLRKQIPNNVEPILPGELPNVSLPFVSSW